jgi:hypothetical protein
MGCSYRSVPIDGSGPRPTISSAKTKLLSEQFQIVLSTLAIAVQSMGQSESAESTLLNGSINDEGLRHWRNSVQKRFLELLRMGCC